MQRGTCKSSVAIFLAVLCLLCLAVDQPVSADGITGKGSEIERSDGGYYTVVGEKGKVIIRTAHNLSTGDEYITTDNSRYRIFKIEGDVAYAKLVGKETEAKLAAAPKPALIQTLAGMMGLSKGGNKMIALYHTHSDESYVPTDGTDSIYANGGIFKVGKVFRTKLKSLGFDVDHSMRPHDPHDANSYVRSRRTAAQLLQKQPMALIDVHRDAVPPNVYAAEVQGKPITRVKIVVGRTNPRFNANLQFAKQIKTALDRTQPNVFEGILLTQGNFNQDLSPRALLVEVGAHTNSRYAAERGIALFADALPKVLGVGPVPVPRSNRGDWTALLWGVLIVGGAVAGFLLINTGNWRGAWEQVRGFFRGEFLDLNRRRGNR